jgi:hypothetical protein
MRLILTAIYCGSVTVLMWPGSQAILAWQIARAVLIGLALMTAWLGGAYSKRHVAGRFLLTTLIGVWFVAPFIAASRPAGSHVEGLQLLRTISTQVAIWSWCGAQGFLGFMKRSRSPGPENSSTKKASS